jgi:hypothetical protein
MMNGISSRALELVEECDPAAIMLENVEDCLLQGSRITGNKSFISFATLTMRRNGKY